MAYNFVLQLPNLHYVFLILLEYFRNNLYNGVDIFLNKVYKRST